MKDMFAQDIITAKVLKSGNLAALTVLDRGEYVNALSAASPGGIEIQEAIGQQEIIKNIKLPTDLRMGNFDYSQNKEINLIELTENYLKSGIKVTGIDDDKMFVSAVLPKDWKMVIAGSNYHTKLIDEKGRERLIIFYKAAFYDRKAYASFVGRIFFGQDYESDDYYKVIRFWIKEGFTVHHVLESPKLKGENKVELMYKEDKIKNNFQEKLRIIVEKVYPDWENCFAYWDLEKLDFTEAIK